MSGRSDDDFLPDQTVDASQKVTQELKGTIVNCVWCKKLCDYSEVDSHGRCSFDSMYSFDDAGKAESIADRGLIAEYMILKGQAIPA